MTLFQVVIRHSVSPPSISILDYPPIYCFPLRRRLAVVNAGERNDYTFLMYITENATGRYLTYTYASSLPSATLLLYPASKPRHRTYFGKEGLSVIGLQSREICLCHFDNQEDFPVGYQGTHIHTVEVVFHMRHPQWKLSWQGDKKPISRSVGWCRQIDMVYRRKEFDVDMDSVLSVWYHTFLLASFYYLHQIIKNWEYIRRWNLGRSFT